MKDWKAVDYVTVWEKTVVQLFESATACTRCVMTCDVTVTVRR